jgi:hypothetical protein
MNLFESRPAKGQPSTPESVAALDLASSGSVTTGGDLGKEVGREAEGTDDEEGSQARGASLSTVLLVSYSSAVTLGLGWVLWTGRHIREGSVVEVPPTSEAPADPGRRSDRSRRLEAPAPIPADHLVRLGKTVHLGALEVTPLSISLGSVPLERSFGKFQRKVGGTDALKLRLRIRNASPDLVFSPLDEAFLRDRVEGHPDSRIELAPDKAPLPMYPLALESEWSIIEQEFRELKPGEVFDSLIVSAADVGDYVREVPEFTWRIRLRTGIDQTEDLGVRIGSDEVRREPASKPAPKPQRSDQDATKGYRGPTK